MSDHFIQRDTESLGNLGGVIHRCFADTAFGDVDNAAKRHAVGRIVDHTQICHRITYFLRVVEAMTADDAVWHTAFDKRTFDGVTLRTCTVQHREIAIASS